MLIYLHSINVFMPTIKRNILLLFCILFALKLVAQKESFKNYSVANGLPQSDVTDAVQDAVGYIWFATQGGGIAKFDGERFKVFNQNNGLISNYVDAFYLQKDTLFIGTNSGLSRKTNNKITNFNTPKINKIAVLNQQLFLATNEGIYHYKYDYVVPVKVNLKIDLSQIIDIKYQNASYWIVTTKDVWKVKTLNQPKSIQKASLKERNAVITNQQAIINAISIDTSIKTITKKVFIDRQQNRWLLTNGNGVYKSTSNSFSHFNKANNLAIRNITATHYKNDTLWFTDSNRNLFYTDSLGVKNSYKNSFKTTAITTDKNNNLWFGSENKGVYIFRKKIDSLQNLSFDIERLYTGNGLPNNNIKNIHIQNDAVWLVTKNAGILKLDYDFENGFVKNISRFNTNNGIKDLAITTSLLHNNSIWYATKNGSLGRVHNNSVTHYSKITKQNTAISALTFFNKQLYIGTLGSGIWNLDTSKNKTLKQLNNSFLSSQNIYQLMLDSKGQLWVGSEKGLDKLEFKNNTISKSTHYNANDGFTGIETSKNTSIKENNGNLWFGTKNGITKYTPIIKNEKQLKPVVYFENIEINNQSFDSIKKKYARNVLQLSPVQNHVSFSFKTVDINHPKQIEYRWTLNNETSSWSTTNTINFANQQSGNYIFSVKSRNARKLESEPRIFHFFIDTPLYKKTWFIWSVSGGLGFIVLIIIASYIQRIQRKNNAKVKKLTLENHLITLEQKALQLQMNPHFIFNVLNGIKAYGNTGNTKELNETISQFASLLRSLLHNSRKEEINLSEEIDALKNYLNLEQQISSVNFEYKIDTSNLNIDLEEILIPPMLLQPFVENSIKHGFKNSIKNGNILISFKVVQNLLLCTIIDNGIGFVQSQKSKTNNQHKSVALKVTKDRIKSLSKLSSIEIIETKENGMTSGTKVEFQIPLKTDY